uniref:Defensin 4 n=1 Tax=Locusta migratoria TaxID=7004 RepID=A0A140IM58_LOCMI|nr:defensin 4 [Locusta migratoria]
MKNSTVFFLVGLLTTAGIAFCSAAPAQSVQDDRQAHLTCDSLSALGVPCAAVRCVKGAYCQHGVCHCRV